MRRSRASVVALSLLIAAPGSAQLPARWPRAPLTETARADVGADTAWAEHGVRGTGSTLCVVDTGVDATHPDLADADGAPRTRWLLDARAAPRGVHATLEAAHGGAVYGPGDALPSDPHGHGTAMASIAVGDGSDDDEIGDTAGVAPRAGLIVVRAWDDARGGFPDDAVLRGVRFCRDVAARDPAIDAQRLVVLLSLGGHDGAHDGRGAFERALAEEASFAPIVVAAGNDGERAVRAAGRVFAGESAVVEIGVPRASIADAAVAITVALDRGAAPRRGSIAVESPSGARAALDGGLAAAEALILDGAEIGVTPSADRPGVSTIALRAHGGTLPSGTYRLHLAGPRDFDVWLAGARLGATFFGPALGGAWIVEREQIAIPATTPALIAVGATVARTTVETRTGTLEQEGARSATAAFSSIGPTADGAPKPDLVAPGGWLLAALSRDVRSGDPENLVGGRLDAYASPDGRVAVRGTSAAAAVVAGALLLALELAPASPDEARARLIAAADGEVWDPESGWGRLDVRRLLADWNRTPIASFRLVATRVAVPGDPRVWLTARGLAGDTVSVGGGASEQTATVSAGVAQIAIAPGPLTVGRAIALDVSLDGAPLASIEVPVALDRGPRGGVTPSGGGCAIATDANRTPLPWLTLLLGALAARRRR